MFGIKCDSVSSITEFRSGEEGGVGEAWYNVCPGGLLSDPRYVHVACVGGTNCGSIWQRYCDWIGVNLFIDYMGTIANEVAGGSGVA